MGKKLIFVSSPLRGDYYRNIEHARAYCRWICGLGMIPYAPHVMVTAFLNEFDEQDRATGIGIGLDMLARCDAMYVFAKGRNALTTGMKAELEEAERLGKEVVFVNPEEIKADGNDN